MLYTQTIATRKQSLLPTCAFAQGDLVPRLSCQTGVRRGIARAIKSNPWKTVKTEQRDFF